MFQMYSKVIQSYIYMHTHIYVYILFQGLFHYCCLVAKLCQTLCPKDCSLTGSSVRGIFQARILERIAISFSRDLPDSGIETGSSGPPALASRIFTTEPPGKPHYQLLRSIESSSL